jgi:hypothetical protein
MPHSAALPFTFRRSDDTMTGSEYTSTRETVHGLLRLDGDALHIQWRASRTTDRVGSQIRTDHEFDPVRELSVPLAALAGSAVRWSWQRWPPGYYLELTAADLRAFEQVAGEGGLRLKHPAKLGIRIARGEALAARDFSSELELALADRAIAAAERSQQLAGEGTRVLPHAPADD